MHLNRFEDGTEVTPELLLETGVVSNEKAELRFLVKEQSRKSLLLKLINSLLLLKKQLKLRAVQTEVI